MYGGTNRRPTYGNGTSGASGYTSSNTRGVND